MKYIYNILLHLSLVLIPLLSHAQNCEKYHIENCRWADRSFFYSRQSRSAVFTPGMTSKFSIVVYGGEEYYISISGHRKLGDIRLRILESQEDEAVLYDNADYKYEEFFFFKIKRTRKLILEITTEETDGNKEKNKKYCLGVLIEFRDPDSPDKGAKKDTGF